MRERTTKNREMEGMNERRQSGWTEEVERTGQLGDETDSKGRE